MVYTIFHLSWFFGLHNIFHSLLNLWTSWVCIKKSLQHKTMTRQLFIRRQGSCIHRATSLNSSEIAHGASVPVKLCRCTATNFHEHFHSQIYHQLANVKNILETKNLAFLWQFTKILTFERMYIDGKLKNIFYQENRHAPRSICCSAVKSIYI